MKKLHTSIVLVRADDMGASIWRRYILSSVTSLPGWAVVWLAFVARHIDF